MAYQLGLKVDTGAYVVSTSTGGPADAAGIQSGDVIVRVDDTAVNTAEDLGSILNDLQPGQTVSVTIDRDGNQQTVDVTLDARPLPTELP
jgi:S1-C subfamily serine protease